MALLNCKFSPAIPIFSTHTGRPFLAEDATELFEVIVSEILTQKVQWDNVVQGVIERANSVAASECQVLVFRISLPINDLMMALKSELQRFEATTEDLVPWITKKTIDEVLPRGPSQSKIAIVGMSCRMPGGATDTEKFWELLENGLDVHRKIPADRFDVETHYDPAGKRVNASHTPYGCFIDEPGLFDAPFFNMSPREAQQTDPMQRLALVTAYEALEKAGGMNVLTDSDVFAGLSHGHFLSKTPNACKTWDCEADGYCRADGIGSIVMKRLEDAEADNDNILGVILGAATNHSAEAISITHPHAGAQSYLFRQVMSSAGVDPLEVSYVEMHGTGTQAGDLVEITSVTDVFAPLTKRRSSKQPLYTGAVKANVGHGEAVAGVTALIKVLLVLQKSAIPPHVGIKTSINPGFPKDLDKRNLHIPYEKQPWPRVPGEKRIAVVNNFGAAGGNTTIAIEEGPVREIVEADPRSTHVVAVSAKSKVSLKGNLERYIAYLDANPDVSLSNLSYSTTARRYHYNYRVAIPTSDHTQLKKQLTSHLQSIDSHKPIPATGSPPVAFAFTGQGSSYKSMNLELFHNSPYFRSQILHLDSLAQGQGFPSFIPAIDGSYPKDHAHSPVITHLAITCIEIALAKYWGSLGVKPDVVIGHSLGEYAALHVAGVLSASDTIFLVGQRAKMLEIKCQSGSHKMMAVRASLAQIKKSAGNRSYEVACINGPKESVLSGTLEQMDTLSEPLQADGYKCFSLDVAFAFHSEQTDPILDDFEEIADIGALFQAPNLPIISPLLGKVIFNDKTLNANYLRRATRETVNFLSALEAAQKISTVDETTIWVEIGPHPVCMGFVKATFPSVNVTVPSLRRGEDNWMTIAQSLGALHCAGVEVSWNEFHRPFERGLCLLDLPTYCWNDKNYWIPYNGDWVLTKGNTFYDAEKGIGAAKVANIPLSGLRTSTVQQVIEENFQGSAGKVIMQSDMMQPDFLAAAYGHKMNDCGVVTLSILGDIAFTLGEYLFKKFKPNAKNVEMNVANLEVLKGLVAQKNTKSPQLIQVSSITSDINAGVVDLKWYTVRSNGIVEEDPFASANIYYGDSTEWLRSWVPATHLVQGRIHALERLAKEGIANRFSHNMAYRLFANNLVNYSNKYRGMQSIVLHDLEAFADITLSTEKGGTWTIPPYYIDSVVHLAGFIMNCSDAMDTKANFCVTPGWSSFRMARPLIAGSKFRSYVKMLPALEDPTLYSGDVYILQDDIIVGMASQMKFHRYPRLLLSRFFSAPDAGASKHHTNAAPPAAAASSRPAAAPKPAAITTQTTLPKPTQSTASLPATTPTAVPAAAVTNGIDPLPPNANASESSDSNSTPAKAIKLIAKESALELADLEDSASFASLGIDSLMSLVLAEKFREELGVTIGGSMFLEYPTIGDLRAWLVEYYG